MSDRLLAVAPVALLGAAATACMALLGYWPLVAVGVGGTAGWLYVAIFDV